MMCGKLRGFAVLWLNKSPVDDSLFDLLYVHGTPGFFQHNLHEIKDHHLTKSVHHQWWLLFITLKIWKMNGIYLCSIEPREVWLLCNFARWFIAKTKCLFSSTLKIIIWLTGTLIIIIYKTSNFWSTYSSIVKLHEEYWKSENAAREVVFTAFNTKCDIHAM